MRLSVLISHLQNARVHGSLDREISAIAYDSRRVENGTLFVAIRGEKADGHDFISQAINQGAAAIVGERAEPNENVTTILVPDSRYALADLAAEFFHRSALHLKMAGVTGTNGKTTFTF